MKVITEAILRDELRADKPESYTIPEGKLLSPAAREYLQQYKIKINEAQKNPGRTVRLKSEPEIINEPVPEKAAEQKYIDYESGAYYLEKPEHMTQLYGNLLVAKDHQRIIFRGKLDSLQAGFVLNQTVLAGLGEPAKLLDDLSDILDGLREMMRCDVLNEPFSRDYIIGLSHQQLREHSHNPMKYYQVKQMVLPDYTLGQTYALLNQLRAQVRETETAAVKAFSNGKNCERGDIVEALNRMSSAIHIIMCKYMGGAYKA